MTRFVTSLFLAAALAGPSFGDSIIVDETFDDYADDAALQAVWVPRNGAGDAAAPVGTEFNGLLTNDESLFPGIQGKAVDHIGGNINQYTPASGPIFEGAEIFPSATQSIFLSADIYESGSGNERMSVGLRSRTPSGNLIELGFWNANSCDPTVAGCVPGTSTGVADILSKGYGYRAILYGAANIGAPLLVEPNWQYFELPQELDRDTDTDDIVNIGDVGAGWHRFMVTITPDTLKFEIDLFRDGVRNVSRTPGDGETGVDASQTWPIKSNLTIGYDSLRIGGPSGVASAGAGAMAFDNILLKLLDVVPPSDNTSDFNGNSVVDAADYVLWRANVGLMSGATQSQGDANGDGKVDNADYDLWRADFGRSIQGSGASVGNSNAVPEPATLVLIAIALTIAGIRRQVQ